MVCYISRVAPRNYCTCSFVQNGTCKRPLTRRICVYPAQHHRELLLAVCVYPCPPISTRREKSAKQTKRHRRKNATMRTDIYLSYYLLPNYSRGILLKTPTFVYSFKDVEYCSLSFSYLLVLFRQPGLLRVGVCFYMVLRLASCGQWCDVCL